MSRELDRAIAEALGYRAFFSEKVVVPYYSTEGNAMLVLDEEMRQREWQSKVVRVRKSGETIARCIFYDYEGWPRKDIIEVAKTEPLARALAAYHALTGKEWEANS